VSVALCTFGLRRMRLLMDMFEFGRNYNQRKITENMECEIMQVVLDEARESYAEEIVIELPSNDINDMESNVERVRQWVDIYKANHS
jgi:adenylate kinase